MSVVPPFELHRPDSLEEVVTLISWDDLPFVGGTELLFAMKAGLLRPRSLIDLKGVGGLHRIEIGETSVSLGAAVSHQTVIEDADVGRKLPELVDVLRRVGNPRVRAAGTLAGNLCFAEPKSDVIPFLIGLDAEVTLTSAAGIRTVPVRDFIVGPYVTRRDEHELLTAIRVPIVEGRGATYVTFQVMERPTVGVAAIRWDSGGGIRTRVVIGAAGERPLVRDVRGELHVDDLAEEAARGIEPVADLGGSESYKRHLTAVFTKRALRRLEDL